MSDPKDPEGSPVDESAPPPELAPYEPPGAQPPVPWMPIVPPETDLPPAPPPPPPPLKPPSMPWLVIGIGVTVMAVLYSVGMAVSKSYGAAFFAFPFFMGFLVAILSPKNPVRNTSISLAVGLVGLVALFREGIICILFALPLLVAELFLGAACAIPIRRYIDSRRKQIATIATTMMISLIWQTVAGKLDDPARHPVHRVESEIVIAAPPERVFDALTSDASVKGPWPWMIRIGLPIPQRLVIEEPGLDGSLRMEFNHGTARARVTAWERGRAFAFQVHHYEIDDPPFFITRLGRGEHYGLKTERVDDWLSLREIRYSFSRDDEGRTVLCRSTVFQRHLSPDFYFGWLQEVIIKRGQDRLLEQIRDQVEPSEMDAGAPVAQAP